MGNEAAHEQPDPRGVRALKETKNEDGLELVLTAALAGVRSLLDGAGLNGAAVVLAERVLLLRALEANTSRLFDMGVL
jgi:hypothetical protein